MPNHRHAASNDLYEVIRRRRDVRAEFTGAPIPGEALRRVFAAAHAAPSVGHSQPWDFIVVTDCAVREAFHAHVHRERDVFAASLEGERRATFEKIKIEGVLESTVGVVVTYDAERGGPAVLGRHAIADAGLYSTCLAIQNLWLAATAENLGVGWVSFFQETYVQDLLAIPRHVRPIAWLCLGPVSCLQTTPDLVRHGWRSGVPVKQVLHAERYGQPWSLPA